MTTNFISTGLLCPEKDNIQQKLQSALPDYNILAGGYIEFYNLSFTKDKTEHHLNYNFRTPLEAEECANYLQFIYCLNYQVTKDLLCLSAEAIATFKKQADNSIKLLDKYRTKYKLLKSFNYMGGWYEYYSLCYDLANYKQFPLLNLRTQQQATQAKQLLAQLGQPTAFYLNKQQAPLYSHNEEYYKGTKKQFIKLIKQIAYSEQQLTKLIQGAGTIEKISYTEVTYYTLKTDNNHISTSLHIFERREQAEQLAKLLTTTENNKYNYQVITAKACLTGDMQRAFNECVQSSLTLLNNLLNGASHD
ncbi:hypothetical protein [Entomomonas asaccharolytica]|uniref:Uncharacterized protein n=1 Tax=Entomomonas asaccharolytica TaxID=2785331 RepID=A0A974NF64_9GAMM|nr:hypothetical protein [Entomomonas asaccharolytica]QQP85469.1 hypothetical protein JHT90_14015 [Entomomonas asaccharolytica]